MTDTITIYSEAEQEIDADGANLDVIVEGSSTFSGDEALCQAAEVKALVDALKTIGIEERQVKLRSVYVKTHNFAIVQSSSANYRLTIKKIGVDQLPQVLAIASEMKHVTVSKLVWQYSTRTDVARELRSEALRKAMREASEDAATIGVQLLGLQSVKNRGESHDRRYDPEMVDYMQSDVDLVGFAKSKGRAQPVDLSLGNSMTERVPLECVFRISEFVPSADPNT